MYVSQAVVDFRRDAKTAREAEEKIARMRQSRFMMFGQNVVTSTLMCEQGARKRGLDLEVAAADARHWWDTGLVPLRATPLAGGSRPPAQILQPVSPQPPAQPPTPPKKKWWEFWKE